MPDILIKDVPAAVHTRLKELASRNRRSMNRQALVLLEEALAQAGQARQLPPVFKGRVPLTSGLMDKAKRAGRL
ncbi:MAG: Arc family DNA-binding protein [Acidobacteriota bacterium]